MKPLITSYAAYNAWANEKTITWLRSLDPEMLYAEVPSSYPSLDLTIQHINRAQKFWWMFITGQDTAHFDWKVFDHQVERIMDEVLEYSLMMKMSFTTFTEDELSAILHLETKWITNDRPRYEYILHIINHTTYHRGQLVTMARMLGIKQGIPNTDYNFFG